MNYVSLCVSERKKNILHVHINIVVVVVVVSDMQGVLKYFEETFPPSKQPHIIWQAKPFLTVIGDDSDNEQWDFVFAVKVNFSPNDVSHYY